MRKFLKEWAPVIGLMLLAGVLRFYELGAWPPGLYHDEAHYGLDALRVLGGERPVYFAANNGREPLFIYLAALSLSWLGRTAYALRFTSAVIGVLTIPLTYWMARELFNRRIGLITAALMTITLWPIHLSLIGFRAVTLPLFVALSVATGVRAYRSGRALDWVIAGALYGASFYTYLASRFTPLALIFFGVGLVFMRRLKRLWPGALIFVVSALIVLAPLAITALTNWDVVMGRPGEVSIFNPDIHHGDPAGMVIGNTVKALGMFFWQGDSIPRHNVPYRPVFDGVIAIFFVFGLVRLILGAIQTRRSNAALPDFLQADFDRVPRPRLALPPKLASGFVLIWIAVMLLPTILAENTPHFLRAVGVLPIALIVPAVGLDTIGRWLEARSARARGWRVLSFALIIGVLSISTVLTIGDYARYAENPETAYAFEDAAAKLSSAARGAIAANYRVGIADRFRRDWTSVSFLVDGDFEWIPDFGQPVSIGANERALLFVWPYEDWWKALKALDGPMTIKINAGPSARGDLDPQPHVGYLQVQIEPLITAFVPEAQFANGAQLLGHSIEVINDRQWRLRALWQITGTIAGDQAFFVHLLSSGQMLTAKDGDSGDGFYPLRAWRAGDVIIDERVLDVPAGTDRVKLLIEIGIYDRATNRRAKVIDAAQAVINDAVLLGGPGAVGP